MTSSHILAIDTAATQCSVALSVGGELLQVTGAGNRQHAREVLPMVQQLLAELDVPINQLDAIAIVRGPGSFTGLRIGTAVAQGLAFASELPIVSISSLRLLAWKAFSLSDAGAVLVCARGKPDEYYWGSYVREAATAAPAVAQPCFRRVGQESLGAVDELMPEEEALLQRPLSQWGFAGPGWEDSACSSKRISWQAGYDVICTETDAEDLLLLAQQDLIAGKAQPPESALPVYLKEDMAYRKVGDRADERD